MVLQLFTKIRAFNSARNRFIHISTVFHKLTPFILSDIGEGIREVTVREWFVKVGDNVAQFDKICLVESDKASVNITSRYDGIIKALHYQIGDTALVGKPLIDIDSMEGDDDDDSIADVSIPINSISPETRLTSDNYVRSKKLATPAVRRIAQEYKISLQDVQGSGKAGRVMKGDIIKLLNETSIQTETTLQRNEDKVVPIAGIKKVMLKTMTESNKIPAMGYFDDINVDKLIDFRNEIKDNAKNKRITITYLPFFIKALSKCIEKFPEINSSLDENCENLIIKNNHNIGIAIDTPKGLIVPNIKNVQNLSISQINYQLNLLTEKGKNSQFTPNDITQGTISISNIGAIGGTYVKPLINPPEVCILAIGKFKKVPIFSDDNKITKSYSCCLSWSADHRVIDGATMARFSNMFKEYIEKPHNLVIDI